MRIKELTTGQQAQLPIFRKKWHSIGICTDPANRPRAESAISEMYKVIGENVPKFVWADSPLTANILIHVWPALGKCLDASLRDSLWASLGDSLWDSLRISLRDSLRISLRDSLWASLGDSLRDSLGDSLRISLRDSLWASLGDSKIPFVSTSHWGQMDVWWIAFYKFSEGIGVKYNPEKSWHLNLHSEIAQSCGWWWPYKNICFVSERPLAIRMNEQERVHSYDKPAIEFRDGWKIYAMNGIRVSQSLVDTKPEDFSKEQIISEKNADVRREIIRKIGIERTIDLLGARSIDKKKFSVGGEYELLMIDYAGDGNERPYLRMQNPSIDAIHIEGVAPECRTVEQALIYRNGLKTFTLPDAIS